jgi:hypothetical protein
MIVVAPLSAKTSLSKQAYILVFLNFRLRWSLVPGMFRNHLATRSRKSLGWIKEAEDRLDEIQRQSGLKQGLNDQRERRCEGTATSVIIGEQCINQPRSRLSPPSPFRNSACISCRSRRDADDPLDLGGGAPEQNSIDTLCPGVRMITAHALSANNLR